MLALSRAVCQASRSVRPCVTQAVAAGQSVKFKFTDGSEYKFHALWLRDACRDDTHVSAAAGERILKETAIVKGVGAGLEAQSVQVENGKVRIKWSDANSEDSAFDGDFLRTYAALVAKPVTVPESLKCENMTKDVDVKWLEPYSGYPGVKAPPVADMKLWTGSDGGDFPRFSMPELAARTDVQLDLMKALVRHGCVIVEDMPDTDDAEILKDFATTYVGALQKDPAREEANWKIAKKENAQSISYNADLRLNNHTDQSIPSHGAVGLLLAVHYIQGHGYNTLTDGIATGEALRQKNPEAFKLLTTYCLDAERDYIASRVDADQKHTDSLLISTKYPMLQTDDQGALWRVQYNEVFRTPSTIPFDAFPQWYAAYKEYADMLHSPEFQRTMEMKKGQLLLVQNWRVLHGRAGIQSPSRTLVGGTITRENFYSKACSALQRQHGVQPYQVHAAHSLMSR